MSIKYNVGRTYSGVVRGCRAWDERGSRNEKVVSSADASSVTIFILHQSPFRFAVTLLQWKRLLTTKSAYTGPPTYFHSSSTTGFPLAPIRKSAIFRARFLHASDDRFSRPRTYAHTTTDRHVFPSSWLSLVWSRRGFRSDNYRARYGNALCATSRTLPARESFFFFAKENRRLCFLKYDRSFAANNLLYPCRVRCDNAQHFQTHLSSI